MDEKSHFWQHLPEVGTVHEQKAQRGGSGRPSVLFARPYSNSNRARIGENLLHHNFVGGRIERALNADALAFELLHFVLVIDVIRLPGVIFQNVLVALLCNRARESLASTITGGATGC